MIIQDQLDNQQVILLRPGTPYVGDAITKNLLKERDADQRYLVIDDPEARIYQLMDEAAEALTIPENAVRNYVTGYTIAVADDLANVLKPYQLTNIQSIHNMYNTTNLSRPLLIMTLKRLQQTYDSSLPIYVAAPNQGGQLTTLGDFCNLVFQNKDHHINRHYSLVVYPP